MIFVYKLNSKLHTTTGNASMSIKHNSGLDVAVFIIHVALKRNCFIYNDLSVYGNTVLGNKLTVHADGYNGTI